MTKKNVIMSVIILLLGIAIGYGTSYLVSKYNTKEELKEKEEQKEEKKENIKGDKYFINYFNNSIPGTKYKFEMDKDGKYTLEVYNATSTTDTEPTTNNYSGTLKSEELSIITRILDKIGSENPQTLSNQYAFYYDNSDAENEVELKYSQLSNIESIVIAIESIEKEKAGTISDSERGNKILKSLIESLDEEEKEAKDGYRHIILRDIVVSSGDKLKLNKDTEAIVKIDNNNIYLNDKLMNLKNEGSAFYAIDLDEDGTLELITRISDNRISPVPVTHYIYKNIDNEFKEVLSFQTIGSIGDFYIKDKDIKLIYEPAEAAPGFIQEEHYTMNY